MDIGINSWAIRKRPSLNVALGSAAVVLLGLALPGAAAKEPNRDCEPTSETRLPCFKVDGRLSLYQGTPSWRIWPFGTKRILGVLDASGKEAEGPEGIIPDKVWTLLRKHPDRLAVRGTYVLCPLTPSRPGEMQMTCIKTATQLRVK